MYDRPFWNFLINLSPIKWFCNLKICKKAMQLKIFQKIFNYEMITYLFFGVLTTVVNWIVYWLFCLVFNVSVDNPSSSDAMLSLIANTIAFVLALIFAFITNKYIVFKSKGTTIKKTLIEFVSFTFARLFTFFLESVLLTISSVIGFNLILMKIIAGIIVVILNYVFSKILIFKKRSNL